MKPQHGTFSALFSCWRLKIVGRWGSCCSLGGCGTSFLYVCMEGWRDGRVMGWCRAAGMEVWRGGKLEGLRAAIYPCSQRTPWQGHPIVFCPTTLPSHHSNTKIHISQPYWPKTFPIPYLPQVFPTHSPQLLQLSFTPSSFPIFPTSRANVKWSWARGEGKMCRWAKNRHTTL